MSQPYLRPALQALVLAALTMLVGCRRGDRPPPAPTSPEQALAELGRAVAGADSGRVFELLDQDSRWSVMSIHRDQLKLCAEVRAHYPKERQPRELERCRAADAAREVKPFFAAFARAGRLLEPLSGLTGREPLQRSGEKAVVAGRAAVVLCREGAAWGYCSLREELERLKLKAARDLAIVQENAEAYKGR